MLRSELLRALSKQHPELCACMDKWFPKVEAVVREVARITNQDEPDVLQNILLEMWQGIEWFKVPRVRYRGFLWELSVVEGGMLKLKRMYRGRPMEEVVPESAVEVPNRTSLYSFVYRNLVHFFLNELSHHFSQQNGFFEVAREKRKVVDRLERKIKEIEVPVFEHRGEVLAFESEEGYSVFDYAASSRSTPEQELQFKQYVGYVVSDLSEDGCKLIRFLLSEDQNYLDTVSRRHKGLVQENRKCSQFGRGMTFSDATICSYMGCTRERLLELRQEIVAALPSEFSQYPEVQELV